MNDLISRKALIETIVNTPTKESGYNPVYLQGCITRQHEILDMIERMPTIEPPKGEWEKYPSDFYRRCSVCKREYIVLELSKANFCPHCGCDMRSSAK